MKNILNIIIAFFFFSTFSCKEKNSLGQKSYLQQRNEKNIDLKKNAHYKSVALKCLGEEYFALKCFDEKEKISILFSKENITFKFNDTEYRYNDLNLPTELGYQTYLFDNGSDKILIIDFFLENGSMLYLYYLKKNKPEFLGKKEIIFSEEDHPKFFNVENVNDGLVVSTGKNNKNINFKFSDAVSLKSFSEVSDDKINGNDLKNSFKLIFSKDEENKLVVDEKSLEKIIKGSDIDEGKRASLLNSYIINILISRKEGKMLSFTEIEIYKILAYTINTTDPIYFKYFDTKTVNWGKYSFGDSRGGSSLSEAIALGKYLNPRELNNLAENFKENSYYHLENLKEVMEKTSWFEP